MDPPYVDCSTCVGRFLVEEEDEEEANSDASSNNARED